MRQPRLEVFGWDERGAPRLLRRTGAALGEPTGEPNTWTDGAGYACARHDAPYGRPWGIGLVLCKRAQDGFWSRWGGAMAAQGLEIRRYIVEDLWRTTPEDNCAWPTLPDSVVEFSEFRYGTSRSVARRESRGVYTATRQIIEAMGKPPVAAFLWGHSEHWHRAPALACRHAGVPTYHAEGAMFPRLGNLGHGRQLDGGHAVINRNGQYYEDFSDIDQLWARLNGTPLTPVQAARIDSYLSAWRQAKASKYGQPSDPPHVDTRGKRLLFVPLQVDRDASLFYARNRSVARGTDLVQLVAECARPEQWHIVAKRHPHDASADELLRTLEARHEHLTVVEGANIHDLLAMADCVCGVNSTVLLEALCYDKPVIALGRSCFAARGFTLDVRDAVSLRGALSSRQTRRRMTDEQRRRFRRFLHMMMWEGNNGNGFFVDIGSFDAARLVDASGPWESTPAASRHDRPEYAP